ncbi:adenylyl-sulfate reductase [Thiosocius teredinicola]|uniref:adenylyl-sulfate reductase n=1 Tax=Thiosocius teredinicola TaxID=1973002 RepID=UPI00157C0539
MFTSNPFAEISSLIPAAVMQGYVILMVLLVIGGTVLDMIHKGSAKYFFENAKAAQKNAKRTVSSGEKASLAVQTVANEVLTSSEFKNPKRRISHLFTMYGFIVFVATSAVLIFSYPTPADQAPALLSFLWHLGALMLCFGGYWFWFFIRVDVFAEGYPWYRLARADLFIVSLLAMATFGLIWSILQATSAGAWSLFFFVLFVIASTTLFSTVLWSKFAHMFFKPAAAFQKRVIKADGSLENLPQDYDLTDPAVQAKYPDIPEYMGKNPPDMGLGIKREAPNHY